MDQDKLNRLLYYLEYRIHTGYEAARPSRDEEKAWAEMLNDNRISNAIGFIDIAKYDLFYFIRFLRFDNTRNKCISCEFEEYIAESIKLLISDGANERYEEYLRKIKKERFNMTLQKVYLEVVIDVDGNSTEAFKELSERIIKLEGSSVCIRPNENYSYDVTDCKITNGIKKTHVPMNIDKIKMETWGFDTNAWK